MWDACVEVTVKENNIRNTFSFILCNSPGSNLHSQTMPFKFFFFSLILFVVMIVEISKQERTRETQFCANEISCERMLMGYNFCQ